MGLQRKVKGSQSLPSEISQFSGGDNKPDLQSRFLQGKLEPSIGIKGDLGKASCKKWET